MSLRAEAYVAIKDRVQDISAVQKVCNAIITAPPTDISPTEREAFLNAILGDLEPGQGIWKRWAKDGRSPLGSSTLLLPTHFQTLLYHSALSITELDIKSSSSTSISRPNPSDSSSSEILKILANLLLLNPSGREVFAKSGGGKAISRALGDKLGINGAQGVEKLFLLGRLGFLVSLEKKDVVGDMVDEGVVDHLVQSLYELEPIPTNFPALSELFKFIANIIRYYPYENTSLPSTNNDNEAWNNRLDPLLSATLYHFFKLPTLQLSPPLSNTIQILLFVPYLSRLKPIWQAIPTPTLANNASIPSTKPDALALPKRLMQILENWFTTYYPYPKKIDEERIDGIIVDEVLPPLLLVLMKIAKGCAEVRSYLKETLLPADLDRSTTAGPLETRKGLLGDIIRLMTCANHFSTRDSAGEFMWAVCNGDAATLSTEIGYGNAAGILFRKGMTVPPPARIEELPSEEHSEAVPRHPITSLAQSQPAQNPNERPQVEMTEEEKEREAERLFVLFDRLEKTKIISAKADDGQSKGIKGVLESKLQSGEFNARGRELEGVEERRRREEEDKEEEEAMRDLREYKARVGKK